jgi:hypothetical protein
MDGRGEEVLERHFFKKHKQSAAGHYHRSALLSRAVAHNPNVRILKLRKPDRPSGVVSLRGIDRYFHRLGLPPGRQADKPIMKDCLKE